MSSRLDASPIEIGPLQKFLLLLLLFLILGSLVSSPPRISLVKGNRSVVTSVSTAAMYASAVSVPYENRPCGRTRNALNGTPRRTARRKSNAEFAWHALRVRIRMRIFPKVSRFSVCSARRTARRKYRFDSAPSNGGKSRARRRGRARYET